MRVLSNEEMGDVAGGWYFSCWSYKRSYCYSYTKPVCEPAPVCEPKPTCDPKPDCTPVVPEPPEVP